MPFAFEDLVRQAAAAGASDIFLVAGSTPMMRVSGLVRPMAEEHLDAAAVKDLAYGIMSERHRAEFERAWERDLGLTVAGLTRLRVNVFYERGNVGVVARLIPLQVPTLDDLKMPEVLKAIASEPDGLVLVTGATGSGKSTTLAAMLEEINKQRQCTIVTVEDPLEFVHANQKALFIQREIGIDTQSFAEALKHVLRQSPDVILIGEMRDEETFRVALEAAETGHLVFSTVHARSAVETMERVVNLFAPSDKPQICFRLSLSLQGVISQRLVPRADKEGRVCAQEIRVRAPHVVKAIEEGRLGDLYNAIKEGEFYKMQTMNQALYNLWEAGTISRDMALRYAGVYSELQLMMRQAEGAARRDAQAAEREETRPASRSGESNPTQL